MTLLTNEVANDQTARNTFSPIHMDLLDRLTRQADRLTPVKQSADTTTEIRKMAA